MNIMDRAMLFWSKCKPYFYVHKRNLLSFTLPQGGAITQIRSHLQTALIGFPRPGNGFTQTGIINGVATPQVQCWSVSTTLQLGQKSAGRVVGRAQSVSLWTLVTLHLLMYWKKEDKMLLTLWILGKFMKIKNKQLPSRFIAYFGDERWIQQFSITRTVLT